MYTYMPRSNAPKTHPIARRLACTVALIFALTACTTSESEPVKSLPSTGNHVAPDGDDTEDKLSSDVSSNSTTLTVASPWAKAAEESGENAMTGVFMTLQNNTDSVVSVISATSPVAAEAQLHETVTKKNGSTSMQQVEGGFEVPARSSRELKPGSDHVMLMQLKNALIPGDVVPLQLHLASGEIIEVNAEVREFSGAQENYSHQETQETHEHGNHHGDH